MEKCKNIFEKFWKNMKKEEFLKIFWKMENP